MQTDDTQTRAAEMLRSGLSQRAVSRELNLSRHNVRAIAGGISDLPSQKRSTPESVSLKGLAGRVSKDRPRSGLGTSYGALVNHALMTDNPDATVAMKAQFFDVDALTRVPHHKLVDQVIDASPEISRALWDFLRMSVAGYDVRVFYPGTNRARPHRRGQQILDEFRDTLKWKHGDESVIYREMLANGYTRGAMILELEMDDQGLYPVDLASPDPAVFCFKLIDDKWKLGQYQGPDWIEMDRITFRHVQLDKRGSRPEGHAPITGALFPALFLLGLFQDLRRVIANQGYPRLDIAVDTEQLAALLDDERFQSIEDFDDAADQLISIIQSKIADVGPGDAYVHLDLVKFTGVIGAITNELRGIDSIITSLERMVARGLKSTALNMIITDTAGESNANRQWEMYTESIKSVQNPAEVLIETVYELALRAYGIIADVSFKFATVRAAEAFRDAQTKRAEIENAGYMQDRGWLTPTEAAASVSSGGSVSDAVKATYGDNADKSAALSPYSDTNPDRESAEDAPRPTPDDDGVADGGSPNADEDRALTRILPPVPPTVKISELDKAEAVRRFDVINPALDGLLDAEIER